MKTRISTVVAIALAACEANPPAPAAPTPATTARTVIITNEPIQWKDPQAAAMAFAGLLAKCDREGAKQESLSFEDLEAMVKHVPDRAAWETPLAEKIENGCKTFAVGKISARLVERKHLAKADDPDKFKRDIDAAIFRMSIDGKELDENMDFFETDRGWLYSALH